MAEMPEYRRRVAGWELTTNAVGANADDLVELQFKKERLEAITDKFKELQAQHALFKRSKQETMLEMKALYREGETLAHTMRQVVRQFYGLGSEKLVEFGIKPNRPRSRPAPVSPGPEAPAPAEAEAATDSPSASDSEQ